MADIPALDNVLSPDESKRISESYMSVKAIHHFNALSITDFYSWFTGPVDYL
jgi:hypothetical protein